MSREPLPAVCRPDGRVLLLEHGLSTAPVVNWGLHRLAPGDLPRYACHLTRDIMALVAQASLRVVDAQRYLFGVFSVIEVYRIAMREGEPYKQLTNESARLRLEGSGCRFDVRWD